jgi:hypothetical protein
MSGLTVAQMSFEAHLFQSRRSGGMAAFQCLPSEAFCVMMLPLSHHLHRQTLFALVPRNVLRCRPAELISIVYRFVQPETRRWWRPDIKANRRTDADAHGDHGPGTLHTPDYHLCSANRWGHFCGENMSISENTLDSQLCAA